MTPGPGAYGKAGGYIGVMLVSCSSSPVFPEHM